MDFCTYFDAAFLERGLALHRSLAAHARDFRLFALALDERTASVLRRMHLRGVVPMTLDEIERAHPELIALRKGRSRAGFYMTLTPLLVARVFARDRTVDRLAYLDADLMFFDDPARVWPRDGSIGVIEHRFPADADRSAVHGRFNVGMVAFTRGPEAARCLERWGRQCLDWCEPAPSEGRFGDQKYLDEWPMLYPGLRVLDHPGANLAPWNFARHRLESAADGRLLVDGQPLVFFHFSAFKPLCWRFHYAGFGDERVVPILRRHVLKPYAKALREAASAVRAFGEPRPHSWRTVVDTGREILSCLRWRRLEVL